MKNKLTLLSVLVFSFWSCTEIQEPANKTASNTAVKLQLSEQNYYIRKHDLPKTPLIAADFVAENSMQSVERMYQKQIAEFTLNPSPNKAESEKRNAFANNVAELMLTSYLNFDNPSMRQKNIYYGLSYLKTGPYDIALGMKVLHYLKQENAISTTAQAEVAYTLDKIAEDKIRSKDQEVEFLKKQIQINKSEGVKKAYTSLLKVVEERLNQVAEERKALEKLPKKSIDLRSEDYIKNKFLQTELIASKNPVGEIL